MGMRRHFAVKELSWCGPKSTSRTRRLPSKITETDKESATGDAIETFGVVAAMSRNRIIGINGMLPWSIPEDRRQFEMLTQGKVLVVGRKTYEEDEQERHVSHARCCIVVSRTADESLGSDKIRVVRSFPDALRLAKEICEDDPDNIECWVAGGEKLYEEGLQHPSAREVHLTIVDTEIDVATLKTKEGRTLEVAQFPAKYRWDRRFVEASRSSHNSGEQQPYEFTRFVYRRK